MKLFQTKFCKRAIFIMAPFVFMACEKPNQELGLDQVIGSQAELADTSLDVVSYTIAVDSLPVTFAYDNQVALGGYTGNRLAGSYVDPYFGRAEAGIVAQMILTSVNLDFGTNPVVDSVNLFLRYAGAYGDTSNLMSLEVLELTESLSRDTIFYSNFDPQTGEKIGGKASFLPKPNVPVVFDGVTTVPTLKIPMNADYFQQKFADVGDGDFEGFASNENFVDYFNGMVIKAATVDGSILYFNLNSNNSRMAIYYHNDEEDSLRVNLNFAQDAATTKPIHFSIFDQDYESYSTGFDLDDQGRLTDGEEASYVQAMGGVATVIEIEGIDELAEEGLLVNKAFLEIPKKSGTASPLPPPERLEVRELTDRGPGSAIEDFTITNNVVTGDGRYRSEELKQGYYVLDLSRYVFNVINGGERRNLVILPVIKSTAANRVILQGGKAGENPMELKIYFTKT